MLGPPVNLYLDSVHLPAYLQVRRADRTEKRSSRSGAR